MKSLETKSNRQDIFDKVSGALLSRIDWEKRKLYLWSKVEKAWQEFDLDKLEAEYKSAEHIA